MGIGAAVLAPPTGDGVLNQIPAGDGRESSREQAVPDDGAPLHRTISCGRRETIPPPLIFHGLGGRAASLTHKKKKKKKSGKKQRRGWCGSGNYTRAGRWGLCERSGMGVEARRK